MAHLFLGLRLLYEQFLALKIIKNHKKKKDIEKC